MNTTSQKETTAAYEDLAIKGKETQAQALFGGRAKPMLKGNGKKTPLKTALMALLIVALFVVPVVLQGIHQPMLIGAIVIVGMYTLMALGLNIVVGYAGLLDFGRIAFYAVGAYTAMIIAVPLAGVIGPVWGEWSIPFILVLAGAMAALAGYLLSLPVMRLRGDYLTIVTLGFGEIVRICLQNNIFGLTNGALGLPRTGLRAPNPPGLTWLRSNAYFSLGDSFSFSVDKGIYWCYVVLLLLLLAIVVVKRQENSRLGRSWAALRDDEVAATAMGINTTRVKTWALVLGAIWGGVAGACFAFYNIKLTPEPFNFNNSVLVLAIVVIGGMGSIPGVIVGGIMLQGFPEVVRWFAQNYLGNSGIADTVVNYRMLLLGLFMIIMMAVRTEGIVPSKRMKRELRGDRGNEGNILLDGDKLTSDVTVEGGGIA